VSAVIPGNESTGAQAGRPITLHPLTYLDQGEEVTVGRVDIDSYAVLPADGAALLRQLEAGAAPEAAAAWYQETYGETVDMADFIAALRELDFVREADEPAAAVAPVRWRRLGRAVFSPVSAVCFLALLASCGIAMARSPVLLPRYHNLFFTHYMTVLELTTFIGQFPLILLHESAHALAGRRLGLRSSLSIGRRLYYMVFLTTMDGLVAVERRKRFVPMLAGIFADLGVLAVLTLFAAATLRPDGQPSLAGAIALAFAYMTLLRLLWQFFFYLQTDLYYVVVTVLDCVDLQTTARRVLRNRLNRLLGRRHALLDESRWHPRDRAVARWYSWLLLLGWTVSIGTLLLGVLPVAWRILSTVAERLLHGPAGQSTAGLADSVGFLAINLAQLAVIGYVVARERRQRGPELKHVLS
jgi:hypothetical protein